jgi:hypothetical protein
MQKLTIYWFSGMTMTECSHEEIKFLEALKNKLSRHYLIKDDPHCYAPPLLEEAKGTYWAEYDPLDGEKYADTCNFKNLESTLAKTAKNVYKDIEKIQANTPEMKFLFCGTSNGAVLALELSKYYEKEVKHSVLACVLVNGCPSYKENKQRYSFAFPIIMMLADNDWKLWKNQEVLYSVAWGLRAAIQPFKGTHSSLPQPVSVYNMLRASLWSGDSMQEQEQRQAASPKRRRT